MYQKLKLDILKTMSKGDRAFYDLKGIRVSKEDCQSLMTYCNLYEREGEISDPWKEKVTSTAIAEVLMKYQMW